MEMVYSLNVTRGRVRKQAIGVRILCVKMRYR